MGFKILYDMENSSMINLYIISHLEFLVPNRVKNFSLTSNYIGLIEQYVHAGQAYP